MNAKFEVYTFNGTQDCTEITTKNCEVGLSHISAGSTLNANGTKRISNVSGYSIKNLSFMDYVGVFTKNILGDAVMGTNTYSILKLDDGGVGMYVARPTANNYISIPMYTSANSYWWTEHPEWNIFKYHVTNYGLLDEVAPSELVNSVRNDKKLPIRLVPNFLRKYEMDIPDGSYTEHQIQDMICQFLNSQTNIYSLVEKKYNGDYQVVARTVLTAKVILEEGSYNYSQLIQKIVDGLKVQIKLKTNNTDNMTFTIDEANHRVIFNTQSTRIRFKNTGLKNNSISNHKWLKCFCWGNGLYPKKRNEYPLYPYYYLYDLKVQVSNTSRIETRTIKFDKILDEQEMYQRIGDTFYDLGVTYTQHETGTYGVFTCISPTNMQIQSEQNGHTFTFTNTANFYNTIPVSFKKAHHVIGPVDQRTIQVKILDDVLSIVIPDGYYNETDIFSIINDALKQHFHDEETQYQFRQTKRYYEMDISPYSFEFLDTPFIQLYYNTLHLIEALPAQQYITVPYVDHREVITAPMIGSYPVDITNNLSFLKIYCSIVKAQGNTMLCALPIGDLYNNYYSQTRLSIPCSDTLRKIQWEIRDENDRVVTFNGNIYVVLNFSAK